MLFHRAILLSGSPLSPLSMVRDPVYYGHQVAKLVNCSPDLQHLQLLNCLRDTPLEQLLNTELRVPEFTTAFGPSVDGVIIDVGAAESGRLGTQSGKSTSNKTPTLMPNTFTSVVRIAWTISILGIHRSFRLIIYVFENVFG